MVLSPSWNWRGGIDLALSQREGEAWGCLPPGARGEFILPLAQKAKRGRSPLLKLGIALSCSAIVSITPPEHSISEKGAVVGNGSL